MAILKFKILLRILPCSKKSLTEWLILRKITKNFLFRSRHPWISVYTTRTFGIIAFKYFTSIVFYFPILLGFAICFHVLFKGHFKKKYFNHHAVGIWNHWFNLSNSKFAKRIVPKSVGDNFRYFCGICYYDFWRNLYLLIILTVGWNRDNERLKSKGTQWSFPTACKVNATIIRHSNWIINTSSIKI